MNQVTLTAETDEIVDRPKFSLLALIGFGLAAVGVLSFQFVQVMPFAILGAAIGAFCLMTAKRKSQGWLTKILSTIAVALGASAASAGYFTRTLDTDYDVTHARNVCDLYLENVSKGDMARVYFLSGVDPGAEAQSQNAELRQAVNRIKMDNVLLDIRASKVPAKWTYVGLSNKYEGLDRVTYRLTYRDEARQGKPQFWLYARRNGRVDDSSPKTARWTVEKIERIEEVKK